MHIIELLNIIAGSLFGIFLFYGAVVSHKERENRAAGRLLFLALLIPAGYFLVALSKYSFGGLFSVMMIVITFVFLVLLFFPYSGKEEDPSVPPRNVDERDTMFSRNELIPDSERYENYYARRPEHLILDSKFRKKPGLLQSGTSQFHPVYFAAARSGFETVKKLHALVEGPVSSKRIDQDPARMSRFIKGWAKKLGAAGAGITELKPYHLYMSGGRGERYGKPVEIDHRFAIAVTVEMDKSMIDAAPGASVVMESAQKYLEAGSIATQIAVLIRDLGYEARAHIDGNYQVICPLVARDAGLGEIGRMGLLMTPKQGPRVRIGVITTTLPLHTDRNRYGMGVQDFCAICKKCAESCPSRAIPFGNKVEIGGIKRWQIYAEACFTLWCDLGTDCGRCIAVCPYSHPDNFFHRFIRWGIGNSKVFRRMALYADDFFYGRKPPAASMPSWMSK